jgi:dephospho-CoA kinase
VHEETSVGSRSNAADYVRRMLSLALTGNIASGKSTVALALQARGAVLIDADAAARAAVEPGTQALREIQRTFGTEILHADGTLDRAQLGRIVFGNPDARARLEAIVHPAVQRTRDRELARARAAGAPVVVSDIPLLFEARLAWQFPRVVLVDAPEDVRIARLVTMRSMPVADATARARAQMPSVLKRERADVVLDNAGSLDALHVDIAQLWARIQQWLPVADPIHAI